MRVAGDHYRICRVERMIRWGADGPETPRRAFRDPGRDRRRAPVRCRAPSPR
ncbi:DUF5954 family protein [Streptomyces sp. NPDC002454]